MAFNVAVVSGRLCHDPEARLTLGQKKVCNFVIGSRNRRRKDFYINAVCWGSLCEYLCTYGKKGMMIVCKGEFEVNEYVGQNKVKQSKMVITCDELMLLHDGAAMKSYYVGKDDIVFSETEINGETPSDEDIFYDLPY